MWSFTLRSFSPADGSHTQDLLPLRERHFTCPDLGSAKQRLSELIGRGSLALNSFYRFEGSRGESKVVIAFYLFPDQRLCPVRIWNRAELFGQASPGSNWMVDFNGVPPWSAITGVEPRWRQMGALPETNTTIGRSARDWRKRNCWVIDAAAAGTFATLRETAG